MVGNSKTLLSIESPGGARELLVRGDRSDCRILLSHNSLDETSRLLADAIKPSPAVLVTDSNVRVRYGERIAQGFAAAAAECRISEVPAGESSKSLASASEVYAQLAQLGGSRETIVIGVGGGVVGDLAGFVAATWVRGLRLVLVPTTLEAAIDASIGGKNALNHPAGKNLIGTFHPPALVLIDTACLDTLPDRDLRAGLAESVKHAVIQDAAFFDWHEANIGAVLAREPAALMELVERNVAIKAAIVEADPRETTGRRALLNYGHTIGHAIEASLADHPADALRHGEAVGIGMVAANHIAVAHAGMTPADAERVRSLLDRIGLPTRLPRGADTDDILGRLRFDKKRTATALRFVLCAHIGQASLFDDVPSALTEAAVRAVHAT